MRHFLSFAKLFATVRPDRRKRPPVVGSAPALQMQEAVNSGQSSQTFPFGVSDLFLGRFGQLKAVKVWI